MKKKTAIFSLLLAVSLVVPMLVNDPPLQADDRTIFSGARPPYVMFLLDNSGSMDNNMDYAVSSSQWESFKSYTLNCVSPNNKKYSFPKVAKDYTSSTSHGVTTYKVRRIDALKRVVIELLDKTRNKIQPGIAHFFYPPDFTYKERRYNERKKKYYLNEQTWSDGSSHPDGAVIRTAISDLKGSENDADLLSMCDIVYGIKADGNTPVAEAMDTAYGYFSGKINNNDGNLWIDAEGNTRIPNGAKPLRQYTCQNSYLLLVSDGEPTDDGFDDETVQNWHSTADNDYTYDTVHSYKFPYTDTVLEKVLKPSLSKDIPAVAKWMYDNPLPDPGSDPDNPPAEPEYPEHGISTWAVGMHLSGNGRLNLETACNTSHGNGVYEDGDDYEALRDKLLAALMAMIEGNFAFTPYTSPKKTADIDGGSYVTYQGYFHNHSAPIWEGHLKCYNIVYDKDKKEYNYVEQWDAAKEMLAQGAADRKLKTQVPASYTGGKFTYTGYDFTTTNGSNLQNSLNAKDATEAQTIIKYILGDAATRSTSTSTPLYLLADIFHSDVIYVGPPQAWKTVYNPSACKTATSTDCFQNFYERTKNRKKAVYAGTNDGVIHAIDATATTTANGGQEIGGFIPDEILPRLKNIAVSNTYTYTTDGRMSATDIYSPTNKWQTVLSFGLREGGKAYYCRDITSPAATTHKWKFPDYVAAATASSINTTGSTVTLGSATGFAQDQYLVNEKRTARARITNVSGTTLTVSSTTGFSAGDKVMALPAYAKYIGETWGKPAICRIKYKKGTAAKQEAWVTILTGGYGDGTNEEGKALFIVNADTGELIWYLAYAATDVTDNADSYVKNIAQLNYPIPQSLRAIDLNNDYYHDTIYFGNTGGHLYKLNIANPDTSTWIPKLLFENTSTTKQPIYIAPSVSLDKCNKIWLHFGTGDRKNPQESPTGQFIAIMDNSAKTPGDYPLTATTTKLQKLISWTKVGSKDTASTTVDTTKKGWYFDFLDNNEILFEPDPLVISDKTASYLIFNTYQPIATENADPCGEGGNMHLYTITLPSCWNAAVTFSAERTDERNPGGGGFIGDEYVQPVAPGNLEPPDEPVPHPYDMPDPTGIVYFKEKTR